MREVAVGAVPFLKLMGIVSGGWMMAQAALAAQKRIAGGDQDPFMAAKIMSARYYADHILPAAPGLAKVVCQGGAAGLALPESMF